MKRRVPILLLLCLLPCAALAGGGVHSTYLWHMHQPIYWPDESGWNPGRYETAWETITLGHSQNDVFSIFDSDDRVGDYQHYPRDAVASILDLPEAGAQVSFAGALIENLTSLGDAGWNGGRYASNWYAPCREARGWTNSAGKPRLEPLVVGFHHAIGPLMHERAFRMELACAQVIYPDAWGPGAPSSGFFPAEMCFSERLIPALVDAGLSWTIVPDLHIARACEDYPFDGYQDNCDPPNPADQVNPAQGAYTSHFISRGVTLKVPYPYGFRPHNAEYVDPATGAVSSIIVVPAANAMGWDEGYGLFGTGAIDQIASANDPEHPMLVLFAHDGDNAWSGGHSYYYENVTGFAHQAAAAGYTPSTVATYLAQHPVDPADIVHVEDGGWVNADGDFGSPQYINWNWPPVNPAGDFDIPGGWAEDERNWAVLTAAQNVVETAEEISGPADPAKVVYPLSGASAVETAWHFLLAGYESGYMYYGSAIDMEIKATLAANRAIAAAQPVVDGGADDTPPSVWLPQRLPWNPGGRGAGSLWGYPGGEGAEMSRDFHVWTFIHDVSGLARVELFLREDLDGRNDPGSTDNDTYAGGADVDAWTPLTMNHRAMPLGEPWDIPGIDFTVLPPVIADQYWIELTGHENVLLDYYVEAEDQLGNVQRSPIQHVWVGDGGGTGGGDDFLMDGQLDDEVPLLAAGEGLSLWGEIRGDVLYLATEGVQEAAGIDHFLMLLTELGAPRTAPWAKAGSALNWDYYLGAENDNNWSGWFDGSENVLSGGSLRSAQGEVLEGTLDLAALFGGEQPDSLWVAALGYANPDGGALAAQAPGGDGDGDAAAGEYLLLTAPTAVPPPAAPGLELAVHPNPFNPRASVRLGLPARTDVDLAVFDGRGRRVATLHRGPAGPGALTAVWRGRRDDGRECPSGVYLIRALSQMGSATRKAVLLR